MDKYNKIVKDQQCCSLMKQFLYEEEVPIEYSPILREYSLVLRSPAHQGLFYCPWCGTKLPKSLRDEFFDIMEKELGLDDGILEIFDNTELPEEFRSDAWWRKRNL